MMDNFQNDLRALYNRQQADLGDVQEARRRVMTAALAHRDEPVAGRLHFAAGIAAVLLAALVIGTFAYIRAGGSLHTVAPPKASAVRSAVPETPTPTPSTGPKAPAGSAQFGVLDTAPLTASAGWILLSNCWAGGPLPCHYSVARTSDGGRTWSKAVQVGPSSDGSDAGVPRKLTFINGFDGFEYGSTSAFVTHDGGRTWTAVEIQASWFALIKGRGTMAWALSYPCPKATLCSYEVRSSVDAGRTWSSPHLLPLGFSPADAVAFSQTGLLVSSVPTGEMQLTLDGGTTWTSIATHCPANTFLSVVTTADGLELWELCENTTKPGIWRLFVSADRGKSWSLRTSPPLVEKTFPSDYSTMLVSPRRGTALTASNSETIKITHDGGRTWKAVGEVGLLFQSITFANASDGWALDNSSTVWTTSDGGDHWQ